jgi:hypothetical protein
MMEGRSAGPVIFQDGDVYGQTVNLASRLASVAQAGEVVVSEDVAGRSTGMRFEEVGPVALKGVTTPMRLFRATLSEPMPQFLGDLSARHARRSKLHDFAASFSQGCPLEDAPRSWFG